MSIVGLFGAALLAAGFVAPAAEAAPSLSVTPLTWNVLGARSNVGPSKTGPSLFPVGARVCNGAGASTASTVNARIVVDGVGDANPTFTIDGSDFRSLGDLAAGQCADAYFTVKTRQQQAAFQPGAKQRLYYVEACLGACNGANTSARYPASGSSRKLLLEKLVNQNRNVTRKVSGPGGCTYDYSSCDPIPTDLQIGKSYTFKLYASTATAYEQVEAFITFPGSTFRVDSVSSAYQTPAGRTVSRPWSNACGWNEDTNACDPLLMPSEFAPTGKAGRNIVVTYKVTVVGTGSGDLTTLIYDFSGSSYHYNSDFGTNVGSYTAKYSLTSTVTGNGSVTSNPTGINCGSTGASCSASYTSGTSVTLTASPAAGQTFTGWGGDCSASGLSSTCTVSMSQARGVTAAFSGASSFPLSVTVQGSGKVTSDTGGLECTGAGGSNCQKSYSSDTPVTLTATPNAGWNFAGWTGDCTNASGTCTVSMTQARGVTALFEPAPVVTRTLAVTDLPVSQDPATLGETLPPTGGTITSAAAGGGGIDLNCGSFCLGEYINGASVTVTATPASGYKLVSWGGACTSATISATPTAAQTCTVPMSQNQNVSANFVSTAVTTTYNLTTSTSLNNVSSTVAGQVTSNVGGIDCGATTTNCIKSFLAGTQVTLTATPAAGKKFNGWKNADNNNSFTGCQNEVDPTTSTTCGVVVDAVKSVRADFLTIPNYYLQVDIGGTGSGGVRTSSGTDINCATGLAGTSADCSETFGSSTTVTLTATPDSGSTFAGFSTTDNTGTDPNSSYCPGTVGGTGNTTCTVTVSQARTVKANFTLIELRKLSVQKAGTGTGALAGVVGGTPDADIACDAACQAVKEKNYNKGTTVALSATPTAGSRFRGWKELDGTSTTACSENPVSSTTCTVGLTVSRSLVAELGAVKTLSGSKTGSGDGSLTTSNTNWAGGKVNCPSGTASCSADYDQGDSVTLTATPDSGSRFAGWGGACSAVSGDCPVTMDAAKSVSAQFIAVKQLTVDKNGNGKGSVSGSVGGLPDTDLGCGLTCSAQKQKTFDKDTVITLTAASGTSGTDQSRFAGWKKSDGTTTFDGCGLGENADTSTTCTVTMSQARNVVAKFVATRTLSVDKSGSGKGTVGGTVGGSADAALSCGVACVSAKQKDYDLDTAITLQATPGASGDDLSRFAGWKTVGGADYTGCAEGSSGLASDCTITLSQSRSLVAQFVAVRTLTASKYGGAGGDGKGEISATVGGSPDGDLACVLACSSTKQKNFDINTQVTLTATAGSSDDDLSEFQGWKVSDGGAAFSGCSQGSAGTNANCTVTLDQSRTLVAQFKAIRRLNVAKSGSGAGSFSAKVGGSLTPDAALGCDVACTTAREKTFDLGTVVELTAAPQSPSEFGGWKNLDGSAYPGCAEDSPTARTDVKTSVTCTVTLSQARLLRAKFNSSSIVKNKIEVAKNGNGNGGVSAIVDGTPDAAIGCDDACATKKSKDLDESTTVVLTAAPVNSGENRSRFAGWKNGSDPTTPANECQEANPSTSTTCTLSMSASRSIVANFILVKKLTVDKTVNGAASGSGGVVTSSSGGISCSYTGTPCVSDSRDFDYSGTGTSVTLTAESADADRYRFDGWGGACTNASGTCTVTMDQARDVTAKFVELRRLSVNKMLNGDDTDAERGLAGTVVSGGDSPVINCTAGSDCRSAFHRFDFTGGPGTSVSLTASVAYPDNYRFDGWAGACTGSSCSLTMNEARSATAKFVKVRKLTVTKKVNGSESGAGGTVTADTGGNDTSGGIRCGYSGTPCSSTSDRFDFNGSGTEVTLTASVANAETYRFDGWSGAGCSGTGDCKVTMNEARSVTGNFIPIRRLTVKKRVNDALSGDGGTVTAASAAGGFTCGATGSPACSTDTKQYDYGNTATSVTLSATPAGSEDYRFDGWKNDDGTTFDGCSGTGDCTVAMSQARTVIARFVPLRKLTVTKKVRSSTDGAGGTVTSNVGSIDCGYSGTPCSTASKLYDLGNSPTDVTLTASVSNEDTYRFNGWDGCDSTPSATTCTVTMDKVQAVTANYFPVRKLTVRKKVRDTLDGLGGTVTSNVGGIDCDASGSGCQQASKRYDLGDTPTDVTLSAGVSDADLYRFDGWKKTDGTEFTGCAGTGTCTVTMSAARDVDARFIPVRRLTVSKTGSGIGATTGKVGGADVGDIGCDDSCGDPKWKRFDQGTTVELKATPQTSGADRSRFAGWKTVGGSAYAGCSEGASGSAATCTVSMSDARSVVAEFKKIKPLTASTSGSGSVSTPDRNWDSRRIDCGTGVTSPDCSVEYDQGSTVALTAEPKSTGTDRTRFRGWKKSDGNAYDSCAAGEDPTTSVTCTVTMSEAREVEATFSAIQPLTVEIARTGDGAGAVRTTETNWQSEKVACGDGVSSPDCQVEYDDGERVTLTATPEEGSTFEGWIDLSSGSGTAPPPGCESTTTCTVTLDQARSVRATFSRARTPDPTPDPAPDPTPEPPASPAGPDAPAQPDEPDGPVDNSTTLSLKVSVDDDKLRGGETALQTIVVKNTGPNPAELTWVWCWICHRMVAVNSQGAIVAGNSGRRDAGARIAGARAASRPKVGFRLGRLAPGESRKVKLRVAAVRGASSGPTKCPLATSASNARKVSRSVKFRIFPRPGRRPFQPTG